MNPNHTWLNAKSQVDDPGSIFAYYRTLIRLRHQMPIFAAGDFEPVMAGDAAVWAYIRRTDTQRMLVLANCGREAREIRLPGWEGATLLLANMAGTGAAARSPSAALAGWEARIYLAGSAGPPEQCPLGELPVLAWANAGKRNRDCR